MKVQRYTYGRSNVSELQDKRRKMVSPALMAEAAGAKGRAGATIASATSNVLFELEEQKRQEQNKVDKLQAGTDAANVNSDLNQIKAQAKAERWTDEQYMEAVEARLEQYQTAPSNISDRNRGMYSKIYAQEATRLRGEAAAHSYNVKIDRTKEEWLSAFDKLGAADDYQGQLSMLEIAAEEGGIQLFAPDELQQMERLVVGEVEADALMEGYRSARKTGDEDKYLQEISETDMPDETRAAFDRKKKDFDEFSKQYQVEQDKARAREVSRYTQTITAATTDDEIFAKAEALDITSYGTINMWFARREAMANQEAVLSSDYLDPHDMKMRKAMNGLIQNDDPEGRVISALELAQARSIVPEYLDGYFNSRAYGSPSDLVQAGESWISLHENTPGLPNGVDAGAALRLNLYRQYRVGFDSAKAAELVTSHFDGMDSSRTEANRKAYDQMGYGNQEDVTPREYVIERVKDQLSEMAQQQMAAERFFSDEVPRFPAEMMRFVETAGEHLFAQTENEEATADTLIQGLMKSGWRVTDINRGVQTGELEFGAQWMKNPPSKGTERTRQELAQDLAGQKFLVNKEWVEVDPERVEFWRQATNPETGEPNWILRMDGALIYSRNGTKQAFEYAQPTGDEDDKTPQERAAEIEKKFDQMIEGREQFNIPGGKF